MYYISAVCLPGSGTISIHAEQPVPDPARPVRPAPVLLAVPTDREPGTGYTRSGYKFLTFLESRTEKKKPYFYPTLASESFFFKS